MQNAGNGRGNLASRKSTDTEYFRLENQWAAALQKKPEVVWVYSEGRQDLPLKSAEKRFSTKHMHLEHVCNHILRANLQKKQLFC